MKKNKFFLLCAKVLILAFIASLFAFIPAHADMAPPAQPPGTNIVPGDAQTQVRMVAETVTLTVLPNPSPAYQGQAATEAVFTMRNLGAETEQMNARFPLTFWDVPSDGYGGHPEINDLSVVIDGKPVQTTRIMEPGLVGNDVEIPWASFPVTFPPAQDVIVTVRYTTNGEGYPQENNFSLRYILQTGAGWQGTIGSADIIVKLPYDANPKNVLLNNSRHADTLQFDGQEVHWRFSDFEPSSYADDISIVILKPSYWQKVLDYTEYVKKYPNDGEGWGQLGKAYKEVLNLPKGPPFRTDPPAEEMYQLGVQAYEKSVTLLPKDALWHYGFAEMLWKHYDSHSFFRHTPDTSELIHCVDELRQSLTLDPENQNAKDLADWINNSNPWALSATGDGYDYLILTVTPTIVSATVTPTAKTPPTEQAPATPEPSPTVENAPTATETTPDLTPAPTGRAPGIPFCGGPVAWLPLVGIALWKQRSKQKQR